MGRVMKEWEWDSILPCHGDVLQSGGKAALKGHLGLVGLQGL